MTEPQSTPTPSQPGFSNRYYDDYVLNMTDINKARTLQRVQAVLALIGPSHRGRLLTLGAGNLVEPIAFRDAGFEVSVADVATTQFDRARSEKITPHQVNLDSDSIPGQYDVVCCMEVLEHLMDPLVALNKVAGAVADGGLLFVSLPDEFNLFSRLQILFGRPAFSHYNWPHIRFFNRRGARELFAAAKLSVVAQRHMPAVPPRWPRWIQPLGRALAATMPGLFSLSHIYQLRGEAR